MRNAKLRLEDNSSITACTERSGACRLAKWRLEDDISTERSGACGLTK